MQVLSEYYKINIFFSTDPAYNSDIENCIHQNVLHWHIIDEESFPLEVPTYPKLWKGAYSKWERYTIEDADEIVK